MFERARAAIARAIAPARVRRFDGAGYGRRFDGAARLGPINGEVGAAGHTLAARSAHLFSNNPLVSNGVANIVGESVGSGIRAAPRHDDPVLRAILTREFDKWADASNFWGLQAAVVQDVVVRGEAFLVVAETDAGPRLRQIDVEQVDRSLTRALSNGAEIIQGVEFDASGERTAYHIRPQRLDGFASYAPPVRVSSDSVLHVYRPLFPGQVRGIPWTASIILSAGELDKLIDALLMAASVAAMMAGFIHDEAEPGDGDDPWAGDNQPSLEPGTLVRLKGGQRVTFSNPQQFAAAGDVVKVQIRSLAAGLGVPAFMLDGDLSGANYSSLRAGLLPFRRRIEQFQYHTLVPQLLAPVWRRVMVSATLAGRIAATDSDLACDWIVPKPLQVDPAKDVSADVKEIANGLSSRRQKVAERGWSIDDLDAEIAADKAREGNMGIVFGAGG